MVKVCICGGGSLGHVCAGVLGSQPSVQVNVLTRNPEKWSKELSVTDPFGKVYRAKPGCITDHAETAARDCDIILLCLPGFAIEDCLKEIGPVAEKASIGSIVSSTGFFFTAHRLLGNNARLFGFQRTPFIARTLEYGRSANLLGYKKSVAVATENIEDREGFRQLVERLWNTPTVLLNSFYEAALTNSNPILHTGRLYSMWKDWNGKAYDHNILFYREWTDHASQILIDMDSEFMKLIDVLPVTKGAIPTLLDYYESTDAHSLTEKIRSIPAFMNILSPMKQVDGGWIPDFGSRYFTEDFPFGLSFIRQLAEEKNISSPTIDRVFAWGMEKCNK